VPGGRAFGAGRSVSAIGQAAGIAEAHRHDGDAGDVVELVAAKVEPQAEALAGGIVPRDAGFVDFRARGLPDDEQPGGRGDAENRAGSQRQMRGAEGAGAGFGAEAGERR
jgi:hypothetical protein